MRYYIALSLTLHPINHSNFRLTTTVLPFQSCTFCSLCLNRLADRVRSRSFEYFKLFGEASGAATMNQYGTGQNVPSSGQQEADLVNNPRYTGQSAGMNPLGHDGRGPAEESRYGAAPLSTNAGTNTGLGTHNASTLWPSPAAPPNAHRPAGVDQYGNPRREGVVDKMKDAMGMGPNSATGYNTRREQPGYGTPGYDNLGQPREGVVDKMKDAVGMGPNSGATGYNTQREQPGYGTPGYDNLGQPRREGVVDKMKDAVGMGPNSGAPGYDARREQPGYGTPGYDNLGQPRREGVVDKMKDAVGMGPNSGATGYNTQREQPGYGTPGYDNLGQPRREGVVDKMKDAVGMGPNSGATGYDARREQPGYGTPGYDNLGQPRREGVVDKMKDAVGMGPNSGATGYDARREQPGYGTPGYDNLGQPRREGVVDRVEDAVGVGPHSGTYTGEGRGFGHHTGTGTGTGFDRSGLDSGFGTHHHDGVHVVPGQIPVVDLGERRVEPGYDASRGQFGRHHQGTTIGGPRKEGIVEKIKDAVGMGKHDDVGHTYPGTTTGTILPNTHETGLGHHNTTSTFGSTPGVGMHHDNIGSTYPGNTYGTEETGLGHHNTPISTPGSYSHNSMVDTGLGHERHPGSNTGYPHETLGEKLEDRVGMPHHDDYERTGKGLEDTSAMHDSRTGTGYDATNVDYSRVGSDDTNVDYGHNDGTSGVDGAAPKKGIMAKIKEKMHH